MESQTFSSRTYELWVGALQRTYHELVETAAALVPSVAGAVLIVLAGWLVAWLLRALIGRVAQGVDQLFEAREETEPASSAVSWPVSRIIAYTVYWLVIVFFVTAAANVLGLPGVAELFSTTLLFLPVLTMTAAVLVLVYVMSGFIAGLVESAARGAGLPAARQTGGLVRGVIVALASIVAASELGVDTTLVVNVVTVLAAVLLGAGGLAFGLGAADEVRNLLASRENRRHLTTGQRLRLGDVEGELVEMKRGRLVVETGSGRLLVPARLLSEQPTWIVEEPLHDD